jgi:UDP-N-acetylglucosamine:LPS N-acetylglucosamine transferase
MVIRKPAIFVPYPLATAGHQTANAEQLSQIGAARLVEQRDLANGELKGILKQMFAHPSEWKQWEQNFDRLEIDPASAAQKIAHLVREVVA